MGKKCQRAQQCGPTSPSGDMRLGLWGTVGGCSAPPTPPAVGVQHTLPAVTPPPRLPGGLACPQEAWSHSEEAVWRREAGLYGCSGLAVSPRSVSTWNLWKGHYLQIRTLQIGP